MTQPLAFEVHVDQNQYLPAGGRRMDAAVSVKYESGPREIGGAASSAAQVIMIDCSSSMSGQKITEAKLATAAAIDVLRDDVAFAVVAGTTQGRMVYPSEQQMVPASPSTRAQARDALRRQDADGGTAIGTWLALANRLLAAQPAQIKHALLLTDGHNQHQTPEELGRILRQCAGTFVCDCRGVGRGWSAEPLLAIAEALLGSAEGLVEPSRLAAEFRAVAEAVMGKAVADVSLRVWTPADVDILFLKQVDPRIVDLTGRGSQADARNTDYPTGQWGAESKIFHLAVDAPAGSIGEAIAVARVSVVAGGEEFAEQTVWIQWTDDFTLSTRMNPLVAHYTGQAELAENMQEGLDALKAGRQEVATARLGRAIQLAAESGHGDTLRVLAKLVDVIDASSGTIRIRPRMEAVDAEIASLQSRVTVPVRPEA